MHRTPPGTLPKHAPSSAVKATVNERVQKAGAAMKADDYLTARTALQGVKERIEGALKALEAPAVQSSRRAR
jgi:hypothetical protein